MMAVNRTRTHSPQWQSIPLYWPTLQTSCSAVPQLDSTTRFANAPAVLWYLAWRGIKTLIHRNSSPEFHRPRLVFGHLPVFLAMSPQVHNNWPTATWTCWSRGSLRLSQSPFTGNKRNRPRSKDRNAVRQEKVKPGPKDSELCVWSGLNDVQYVVKIFRVEEVSFNTPCKARVAMSKTACIL